MVINTSEMTIPQPDREQLIASHPVFSLLSPEDISKLALSAEEILVPKSTIIVNEGELVDSVYLIADGSAEVTRQSLSTKKKKSILLAKLIPGESIGLSETGFFSKTGIRTATVTAIEDMTLLKINIEKLRFHEGLQQATDRMLKMNLVKRADPFAELSSEEISELVDKIEEMTLPPGQFIFKQGEEGECCYLLREGSVKMVMEDEKEKKILSTLTSGSVFGMGALQTLNARNASAISSASCRLLVLHRTVLEEILKRDIFINHVKVKNSDQDKQKKLFRRHVTPKHIPGLIITDEQTADGECIFTLKNPEFNSYYQLTEEGWRVWSLIDDHHTIQSILNNFNKQFGKKDDKKVLDLLDDLQHYHLISIPSLEASLKNASFFEKFLYRMGL